MTSLFAQAIHWGVALIPVLIMVALFVWLDAFKLMNLTEVLILLALGGLGAIASYPVSGRMIDVLPIGFSNYSRFVAPWIEEAIKAVFMILLFRFNRIGYKLDAVIAGFAIGAGFSVIENVLYLTIYPNYGTGTWLVRGLGTAVMHGTTLALLAASAHELSERETRGAAAVYDFRFRWFVPGYLVAVAIHAAFNQFPDKPLVAMLGALIVAPVAIISILSIGTSETQRWLAAEHADHKTELERLGDGGWPDTVAGRKIAALAARLDGESGRRVHRFWEVQAWLVAEAEKTMIEEAEGDVEMNRGQIRSAFAELDGLRRALGRSTYTALTALLPYSRNDYWELGELRQRVED